MSDVDFVVLDLDGGAMLETCLRSIAAQTRSASCVIVLDNGSAEPVAERIGKPWKVELRNSTQVAASGIDEARVRGETGPSHGDAVNDGGPRWPDLIVIRSEANIGFAAGVNLAAAHGGSPFVALVNNDVVLDPEWLEVVREAMKDDVGAVQTVIRGDEGTIDGAGIDIGDGTIRQRAHGMSCSDSGGALPGAVTLAPAWGVSATAALYRRELLSFDERFFAYYEDAELSARLHEQGWKTVVLDAVRASHGGSATAHRLGRRAIYLRTRNRYFVARMHRGAGRLPALLLEDLRLLVQGRSSLRGIIDGLTDRLSARP